MSGERGGGLAGRGHRRTLRVDGFYGVPYADRPGGITARNVEAARREAGHGRLGGVADILLADGGVVDGPQEDGFAGLPSTARVSTLVAQGVNV